MSNKNSTSGELELIFPTSEYRQQLEEYMQEHIDNNEHELVGDGGFDVLRDFDKWLEKINNDLSEKTIKGSSIPSTVYLGVRKTDNKVVGILQIRHKLSDYLYQNAGHIGDGVRPSERRKGYATEMIGLAIKKCEKMGMKKILMICDKENIGSAKSIMNNGGILEDEIVTDDGKVNQRYWINTQNKYASKYVGVKLKSTPRRMVLIKVNNCNLIPETIEK